jgi:LysM repeat protein
MTQINKLSDTQLLDIDKSVIVPINCSCVGNHSQANTTHVVQSGDSYLIIANNTYQGLSTCQAMTQQNSVDSTNLRIGMSLRVPLRCACPTTAQVGQGFNYLMSYLVRKDVTLEAIALRYGATVHQLRDANNLTSSDDTLFPYTTVLVPLQKAPSNSPPPQPSKNIIIRRGGRRRSGLNSGQLVGVSVGTAAAVASVAAAAVCCVLFWRRRKTNGKSISEPRNTMLEGTRATTTPTAPPDEPRLKARGRQTLLQYELKELEAATENFNASNKIGRLRPPRSHRWNPGGRQKDSGRRLSASRDSSKAEPLQSGATVGALCDSEPFISRFQVCRQWLSCRLPAERFALF